MESGGEKMDNSRLGAIRAGLENALPTNWVLTTLGEVFKWRSGGTPLRTHLRYYGGDIPWLNIGDLNDGIVTEATTHITAEGLDNSAARWVEPGSVMLAMYGSIGKLGIAGKRLTTNQAIAFTQPDPIESKFLFYYLMHSREALVELGKGATQKNISQAIIKGFPFPLAPIPEQRRIVEAIDLQLNRLEGAVARLRAAKGKLKQYKQVVLKAAVEGPLVERTHEWITIDEASERIIDCLHSTPKFTEYGKYCIDTTCIEQGVIRFDKARFVTEDSYKDRIRRLKPEAGDILFAREGTVGTTVVVPENVDLCLGQRMMMFRLKKFVLPEFFMFVMQSPIMVDKYRPLVMGTTAPHLNIRDIRKLTFPLYSITVQRKIIARLDGTFEALRKQDAALDSEILQIARLRQAVLSRAFEGSLILPESNDESATVLLERIKHRNEATVERTSKSIQNRTVMKKQRTSEKRQLLECFGDADSFSPEQLMSKANYTQQEVAQFYEALHKVARQLTIEKPTGVDAFSWPQRSRVKIRLKGH